MYKIGIIGHFGIGKNLLNGQTIKTKNLTEALKDKFGASEVLIVDTHNIKKNGISIFKGIINLFKQCDNIIMLPAHNGLKVFAPFLSNINRVYKRKLHYVVVGGWLAEDIKNNSILSSSLMKFDYIYVETKTMKTSLEDQGFSNIKIMPNFKKLEILTEKDMAYSVNEPYKICTFSRVMKEKGIEDIVKAVEDINSKSNRTLFRLDIYGAVDKNQIEWFEELKTRFPEYICYKGMVPYDGSVQVLKDYYALIFPTKFYTEGIPGTILDAYAAGVPVVASEWESCNDIMFDGFTGLVYDFDSYEALKKSLKYIADNVELWNSLKANCTEEAEEYTAERIIDIMKF